MLCRYPPLIHSIYICVIVLELDRRAVVFGLGSAAAAVADDGDDDDVG